MLRRCKFFETVRTGYLGWSSPRLASKRRTRTWGEARVPPLEGLNSKYLQPSAEALGYDLPSRVAGLGSFPVQLAADLKI